VNKLMNFAAAPAKPRVTVRIHCERKKMIAFTSDAGMGFAPATVIMARAFFFSGWSREFAIGIVRVEEESPFAGPAAGLYGCLTYEDSDATGFC
jgi:hypothetical protein